MPAEALRPDGGGSSRFSDQEDEVIVVRVEASFVGELQHREEGKALVRRDGLKKATQEGRWASYEDLAD